MVNITIGSTPRIAAHVAHHPDGSIFFYRVVFTSPGKEPQIAFEAHPARESDEVSRFIAELRNTADVLERAQNGEVVRHSPIAVQST